MRLIYHDSTESLTFEQIQKGCQQGYGIENPEKVSGFMGFFYMLPDIYVYGMLEHWMDSDERLEKELLKLIIRFNKEDYGFVTRAEHSNNLENKWLCGSAYGAIARYSFDDSDLAERYGGVVLEFFKDYGLMYSMEEDMKEICGRNRHNRSDKYSK